jgi:gamma-glutamylcyclotransferase (GGCT)/AIG2-like uncharacterized protein YtfP
MIKSQPKKGKKKTKKLSVVKVQVAVNAAIRRRDGRCVVTDDKHACAGVLTASHFYSVGGNGCLRFYPPNIHAQCFGHHGIHERNQDPVFYHAWMMYNYPSTLEFMNTSRGTVIKYDQDTLRHIKELSDTDQLDILQEFIELRLEIIRGD